MHVAKRSTQRFCSYKCQNQWQTTLIGENNSKYKRKKINCDFCGKEYSVRNYIVHNQRHHFCSVKCRQAWYSTIFSQSNTWRQASQERALKILETHQRITNTRPQVIVNEILDELNVSYINEQIYDYYAVDNYLPKYNLIIEVMGDFWHCNPIKYPKDKYDIHNKNIGRDKAKHNYIHSKYNIEILYLWENDIYNHPDVCKNLIIKYITNNGHIPNYHSFNYTFKDGVIELNKNLILPYFQICN